MPSDVKTRLAEGVPYIEDKLGRKLTRSEVRELEMAWTQETARACGTCGGNQWLQEDDGNLRRCQTCSGPEPLTRRLVVAGFMPGEIPMALHDFKPERQPKGPPQSQARTGFNAATKWVKGESAPTLLLTAMTGAGKTHLAHGAALELCKRGQDVVVASGPNFATLMRRFEDGTTDRYRQRLRSCAWLVFDDIGAASHDPSGYLAAEYQGLIDERYRMARPSLFTSNFNEADLSTVIGARAVSRLYDTSRSAQVLMRDCVDLRRQGGIA